MNEFESILNKLRAELKADAEAFKTWNYLNEDTATSRVLNFIGGQK